MQNKRFVRSTALILILLVVFCSCGNKAQESAAQNDRYAEGFKTGYREGYRSGNEDGYKTGYDEGLSEGKQASGTSMMTATFSGEFTATVEKLIPDYYALPGNTVAVVHYFQDGPFLLRFNEDMTGKLVEGETYVFSIQPYEIRVTSSMIVDFKDCADSVTVTGYREVEEDEMGLDSKMIEVRFSIID